MDYSPLSLASLRHFAFDSGRLGNDKLMTNMTERPKTPVAERLHLALPAAAVLPPAGRPQTAFMRGRFNRKST
jgi:hypothetical protein